MRRNLNLSFYLWFAILQLSSSVCCFEAEIVETIDLLMNNYFLPNYNAASYGLGIVKLTDSGTDFLSKGYGYMDLENQIEADNQTLYAIGSISKSFTATIVVKTLSEKYPALGESVLDMPIRTLVPSMNFTLMDRFRSERTSFRDLLSHRTCLNPGSLAFILRAYKNKEEFMYRMRYADEVCPFRTYFVYNNAAYIMAGEIIAQIANSTFENMLSDLLLELGMNSTTVVQDSVDYENVPNMSRPYYIDQNGEIKRYSYELLKWITIASAPGGILSTSADMLKYMLFHINNGKVGDKQIVSEAAIKYLRRSSIPSDYFPGKANPNDVINGFHSYGLALKTGLLDGWEMIGHTGRLPPYVSYMTFYPALNLGIFSTTNGPNLYPNGALHQKVYEIIEKGLRNYDKFDMKMSIPNEFQHYSKPAFKFAKPRSNLKVDEIVGVYGNGFEAEFTVSEFNGSSDGSLYMNYGILGTGILRPLTNTSFTLEWDTEVGQLTSQLDWKSPTIDFGQENKALFIINYQSIEEKEIVMFEKNLTLDKLPTQPWASDSCGPATKY